MGTLVFAMTTAPLLMRAITEAKTSVKLARIRAILDEDDGEA